MFRNLLCRWDQSCTKPLPEICSSQLQLGSVNICRYLSFLFGSTAEVMVKTEGYLGSHIYYFG